LRSVLSILEDILIKLLMVTGFIGLCVCRSERANDHLATAAGPHAIADLAGTVPDAQAVAGPDVAKNTERLVAGNRQWEQRSAATMAFTSRKE
jgi:hypothetical protein